MRNWQGVTIWILIIMLFATWVGGVFVGKWYVDKQHDHAIKWSDTKDKNTKSVVKYDLDDQAARIDSLYEVINGLEASIARLQSSLSKVHSLIVKLQDKQKETDGEIIELKTKIKQAFWALWEIVNKIAYESGRTDNLIKAVQGHGAKTQRFFIFWKRFHDKNLKDLEFEKFDE